MKKSDMHLAWMGLVAACFLALYYFVIPTWIRAHTHSATNACINNLRQIDGANQQWELENKKSTNDMAMASDIQPYMGRGSAGSLPTCPGGGRYIFGRVGETPRCTIGGPDHTLN